MKLKFTDILIGILLLTALILLILKLFGSPSFEAIIAVLMSANSLLWERFLSSQKEFLNFKSDVKLDLEKIKSDLEKIKLDSEKIKHKLEIK